MRKREMTEDEVKRLNELNEICMECIALANRDYIVMDRKRCMSCEIGSQIHALDPDNVDGHNSGRYERYFTA